MVSIKNTQKITFTGQLVTEEKYVMVSIRDLNISNEKQTITSIVKCFTFNYKLDEEGLETTEIINLKELPGETKPIKFNRSEMHKLMQAMQPAIGDMDSFDAFQNQVLMYLAQRDQYFGLANNWEIV
ncbi:hypothetical protein SAMN05216480_10523 [Pustulibacterium marinum]|uniref:Uncharacterized protein n=1 Tax=Pustulibacterium marinum TaxID=1224947 RepID=A0A1I7GK96_9FLAO|nr:hypothetical protein [Pustulibacterium marinum]SFU48854.1 hypothetical protein SAMN05216480_10523 [Pustulibacterium marinum]